VLGGMKILGITGYEFGRVLKEVGYRKAEMLGDMEEWGRWWQYNVV